MEEKKVDQARTSSPYSNPEALSPQSTTDGPVAETKKLTFWQRVKRPGSVWQIIIAAVSAIALGLIVSTQVKKPVPESAIQLTGILGQLWLRALKAVVLPMIVTAMILAIQRLREISEGGKLLARWTIGYYIVTTIIAVSHSCILVGLVWSKLMIVPSAEALKVDPKDEKLFKDRSEVAIHEVIVDMFESLVPDNVVAALAQNSLLAVLVTSVVVGYCIKPGSSILKAVVEIEQIIMRIITILIYFAPVGVFFLILPNLFRLDIAEIGLNLGILIGGTLSGMILHLFILIPIIFFAITRRNPYTFWFSNSPAWITAWGTASSAATLPVTMRCTLERGVPVTIAKFAIPLGCLINMDGTAIYFPIVVVFLAATQGITLSAANYIVIILLSTLASIGTTPIPSSSLVLIVMIAGAINVPITGMYAVVIAIDWFLDRFRTAVNVSGDLFAAVIVQKITGIKDPEDGEGVYDENGNPIQDQRMNSLAVNETTTTTTTTNVNDRDRV